MFLLTLNFTRAAHPVTEKKNTGFHNYKKDSGESSMDKDWQIARKALQDELNRNEVIKLVLDNIPGRWSWRRWFPTSKRNEDVKCMLYYRKSANALRRHLLANNNEARLIMAGHGFGINVIPLYSGYVMNQDTGERGAAFFKPALYIKVVPLEQGDTLWTTNNLFGGTTTYR